MDGILRYLSPRPIAGRIRDVQTKFSSSQFEAAKLQHLAAAFEYWVGRLYKRDPKGNQPSIPKMRVASGIGHAQTGAGKGSHENSPIGTAEIEGDIEPLVAQSAKNLPLLPERAFLRGHFNRPCAVHARRKSQHFAANRRGQDM